MNKQNEKVCLSCDRTEEKTPVIALTFKGEIQYICPQCFPILIHKTWQLSDKFPGVEIRPPAEH